MGKRSRKRGAVSAGGSGPVSPAGTSRAERDAARQRRTRAAARGAPLEGRPAAASGERPRRRRSIDERPPAPWGKFPLVELVVLLALGLFVAGLIVGGTREPIMFMAALVLGSLAGLELVIREHFGGFRSHTSLLAFFAACVAGTITYFATGGGTLARAILIPVAGVVFLVAFWLLRQVFKRRSGGLSFR
ncbi:MAG: hypothetical protein JOZ25_10280 [Actinobacteria bacterium]|nr:hypothetical protein [Actinomycetota bacterium]